MRKQTDMQPGV